MRKRCLRQLAITLLVCWLAGPAIAADPPDPQLVELLRNAATEADSFADQFDAQVWLTDMSARLTRQVADPQERLTILKNVHYEAKRADLPPNWYSPSSMWKAISTGSRYHGSAPGG